ncbi:hypothetical protein DYB37_012468 [Aphanomyces astaci]|uniref:Peptidase S1 domain-containing protein n=1 Tax=Aphanomyces astaci TaxID=112090 RepID=A0A397F4Y8_APHAT|nr:hypothetical protein AaE_002250 [Aphanomyces astaci]RHY08242.1 hypothetical protein DYB36_005288 [Aphanomyces astaci]RHY63748.1 hypothetical protein DYB34_005657 [Aphanomyces astaci]RHY64501.1 hypothetical protein DYB38_005578 [Aphanomyces astaci]RHY64715.1 hypothetical protein DYB30_005137 [Aphanomyces astaci]
MQKLFWIAATMGAVVVHAYSAGFQNAKISPYVAQLRSSANDPMICQGILIDPNIALFTQSCAELYDEADKVVIGASRINGGLDDGEWNKVLSKAYSPNRALDFALVQLARQSNYTPVQILWDDVAPGKVVWLRGWLPFNSDKSLNRLVETTVQVITNDQCQAKLKRPMYDFEVCGDNDGIDSCSSYISGPLITEIGGRDFLVGTMSDYQCVHKPVYQIFNRLSAFRPFIEPILCGGK